VEKMIKWIKWLINAVGHLLKVICGAVSVLLISAGLFSIAISRGCDPQRPNIMVTQSIVGTESLTEGGYSGRINLSLEIGKEFSGVNYYVRNVSPIAAEDLQIACSVRNTSQNTSIQVKENLIPSILRKQGKENATLLLSTRPHVFYYTKFAVFPGKAQFNFSIMFDEEIEPSDVSCEFLSRDRAWQVWPQGVRIGGNVELWKEKVGEFFVNLVYADSSKKGARSGIYISGYDPVVLLNNLFTLLQENGLIGSMAALRIKEEVENSKEGALFGGINILKFNEVIINQPCTN